MILRVLALAGCLALPGLCRAAERERNYWPVKVVQTDEAGRPVSWQGAGPLVFWKRLAEGGTIGGVRGIYLAKQYPDPGRTETSVLYPLFVNRVDGDFRRWTIFGLINRTYPEPGGPTESSYTGLDIWPFYFSRQTGVPESSYRALFPLFGTIKYRLFNDRISFVLAPLYVQTESNGSVATSILWPIVRTVHGAGNSGFQVWPLFGRREREGVFRRSFYLWPFIYREFSGLNTESPVERSGVIPLFTREDGVDFKSRHYGLFGYTDRWKPYRYHETDYLFPLFVQGRGDDRYRNRWAPFYTHSVVKGMDKTWVMWPIWKQQRWTEQDLTRTKTQLLFFVYLGEEQRSATNPNSAVASKRHFWPLFSTWDNGAGQRQLQVLSPFEIFFPQSETVRESWTPLAAVYRSERRGDNEARRSFLFDFITWRRGPDGTETHIGPLLKIVRAPGNGRVTIAMGDRNK